jgi:hypothetical protein
MVRMPRRKSNWAGVFVLEARDPNHAIRLMSKPPGVGLGWTNLELPECGHLARYEAQDPSVANEKARHRPGPTSAVTSALARLNFRDRRRRNG